MAKPVVDRLEDKLEGQAEVIRLDLLSEVGRQAAARYGVRGVPTLIVVDGNGRPVHSQAGVLRSEPVLEQIETINNGR